MKARVRWLTGSVLLAVGLVFPVGLGWGRPAMAGQLEVSPVVRRASSDQVELEVTWAWNSKGRWPWSSKEDRLLAVSFDTRQLVMEQEEAPAGKGGYGPYVEQLGAIAVEDGARRLFTIPEGRDGRVRLLFHTVDPAGDPAGVPLRIYVVTNPPYGPVEVRETRL